MAQSPARAPVGGPEVRLGGVEPDEERLVVVVERLMKFWALARNSVSHVSMRFLVSGPVSSMRFACRRGLARMLQVGSSRFRRPVRTPRGEDVLGRWEIRFGWVVGSALPRR